MLLSLKVRSKRVNVSICLFFFFFCSFWEEVVSSKTSCHKYSIHYHSKQYLSFLGMKVIVQCDTQSVFKMVCIMVYLKKQCTSH